MSLIHTDWDFQKLEELIQARGEEVVVETGIPCSCRNGDLYASLIERDARPASYRKFSCYECQGDGWVFRNARIVLGLVTGVNPGNRRLIEDGYALPGDSVFSPSLHAAALSDFDRVTFQFPFVVNEGEVKLRGAAHMEDNAHIETDLTPAEDRLWYIADCSLWCEDENGVVYYQDADFELEDRKIRWIGSQPLEGTLYTIKYTGYPEWISYVQPLQRFDRNRTLGQRVLLRKKHVAFSTGSSADTPAKRQEEQVSFTKETEI